MIDMGHTRASRRGEVRQALAPLASCLCRPQASKTWHTSRGNTCTTRRGRSCDIDASAGKTRTHLVVDVDLAHLRGHPFSLLLLDLRIVHHGTHGAEEVGDMHLLSSCVHSATCQRPLPQPIPTAPSGTLDTDRMPLTFFRLSASSTAARILSIPVIAMNSGSSKGVFSIPRLPWRYLRFWHQCRGTVTVLR